MAATVAMRRDLVAVNLLAHPPIEKSRSGQEARGPTSSTSTYPALRYAAPMQLRFVASIVASLAACGSRSAPTGTEVGATPPAITLTSTTNTKVALADITHAHAQTVVVFYKGYF